MRIANKELIFIRLLSLFSGIGAWEKHCKDAIFITNLLIIAK